MTQLLLSLIPLIVVILTMLIFKINIKGKFKFFVDKLFWGFIIIFIVLILSTILKLLFPFIYETGQLGGSFLYYLIFAALIEEIAKFISLLATKPKNHKQLIINGIFIATLFSIIEHYMYMGNALSQESLFIRLATPGHALYLLIPIWFIILGTKNNKKGLFTCIGLLLGILVHAIFDTIDKNVVFAIIFGIIGYAVIIYSLYKASKMIDNSEESKDKLFVLKLIVIIICCLFSYFAFNQDSSYLSNGKYCHYNSKDIDIKVNSAEIISSTTLFGEEKTNFIKVEVTIKNNNKDDIEFDDFNFRLKSNKNDETFVTTSNVSDKDVDSNNIIKTQSEKTKYIYFEVDGKLSDYRLEYSELTPKSNKCVFKLEK